MELRQLRYFTAVAESQSLTNAAGQLFISQPALTENIKNLEQELGTKLFTRSRNGMELTSTGVTFLDYAQSLLNQASKAKEVIDAVENNPKGEVSLALPTSISHSLSVPLFTLINDRYPGIRLRLEEYFTSNMGYLFGSSEFDFIVTFDVQQARNTLIEPMYEEKLYLITQYKEGRQAKTIKFEDLVDYSLMMPRLRRGLLPKVREIANKKGMDLNIYQSTAPLLIVLKLTELGITNAVLPWPVIRGRVKSKTINAYEIVNPGIKRTIIMVWPENRPLSNTTRVVMDAIRDIVRDLKIEGMLGR